MVTHRYRLRHQPEQPEAGSTVSAVTNKGFAGDGVVIWQGAIATQNCRRVEKSARHFSRPDRRPCGFNLRTGLQARPNRQRNPHNPDGYRLASATASGAHDTCRKDLEIGVSSRQIAPNAAVSALFSGSRPDPRQAFHSTRSVDRSDVNLLHQTIA